MFDTAMLIALGKIALVFTIIITGITRKWGLWPSILIGAACMGFLCGLSPIAVAGTFAQAAIQPRFLALGTVVTCILLLSEVQEYTGQGNRLVRGLEPYMRSPRLRLIFFPALIGLLPMPGGAIFSCPMVRDIAAGTNLSEDDKGRINYWFRHIWEIAWPLYPGYILACGFTDIPITVLWIYTWPMVLLNLGIGIFFFLRRPVTMTEATPHEQTAKIPLRSVLLEGLPIVVAIAGALVFSLLFTLLGVQNLPTEAPFIASLLAAVCVAVIQTKTPFSVIPKLLFKRHVIRMVLILFAIFAFKDTIIISKITEIFASTATSNSTLLGLFILLPILCGLLTGLMAGFVGTAFPLLIPLLYQMGLYDDRLIWIVLALIAGNLGQMLSPVHTCLVVTADFFRVSFVPFWRKLLFPAAAQFIGALAYVTLLWSLGTKL